MHIHPSNYCGEPICYNFGQHLNIRGSSAVNELFRWEHWKPIKHSIHNAPSHLYQGFRISTRIYRTGSSGSYNQLCVSGCLSVPWSNYGHQYYRHKLTDFRYSQYQDHVIIGYKVFTISKSPDWSFKITWSFRQIKDKAKVKLSLCFFNWAPCHEDVLGNGYVPPRILWPRR
jgi:hypothetical protein